MSNEICVIQETETGDEFDIPFDSFVVWLNDNANDIANGKYKFYGVEK